MPVCQVCFHHCELKEGQTGFCGGRICVDGVIRAGNYGQVTAIALDPVEKKPLQKFFPGSRILSVGSYGCNLRCPFCQNYEITWSKEAKRAANTAEYISPKELAAMAESLRERRNIGVAFTYNEPLIGYEYVRDTAKIVHEAGMKNVLVTNGTAELAILDELAPYIDAMNIDLKGFTDHYYTDVLGGDRRMVMNFIQRAVQVCHVELTTLIVPGENDTPEEMQEICGWIAGLTDKNGSVIGPEIPLHISRYFPRFLKSGGKPTDTGLIYRLADLAREQLNYVYTGNC